MESNVRDIQPGTRVYSRDDEHVGDVEEVGTNYLRVRKGWFFVKERYIPFDAIGRIDAAGVYLTGAKAQLDAMAWDEPPAETASALVAPGTAVAADVTAATAVSDAPVTAQAPYRDDIHGERRAAAAADSGTMVAAFQEGMFEVRARREEIIVTTQARVIEELVFTTNLTERTETVQETVRRTRVDIDELTDQTTTTSPTTSIATANTAADEAGLEPGSPTAADEAGFEPGSSTAQKPGGRRGRRRLS